MPLQAIATPLSGAVQLKVKFTADLTSDWIPVALYKGENNPTDSVGSNNAIWKGSTSKLFKAGTMTSSWNMTDIYGNPRPDVSGCISIGAQEPVY
jgi:hypothetical protein